MAYQNTNFMNTTLTFIAPTILALVFIKFVKSKLFLQDGCKNYPPIAGTMLHHLLNFKRLHHYMTDLATKHKTYRILNPFRNEVYASDRANVEYILKTNFDNFGKGDYNYDHLSDLLGDGIFAVDGDKWRNQRKVSSYEFSTRNLREFSSTIFREKAMKLANVISNAVKSGNSIDIQGGLRSNVLDKFFTQVSVNNGTKWAVLIAGSKGFSNYRHQADVCHAYQILRNGGLKDENIIVFMYDDIAYDSDNPRPGIIINNPKGVNVYPGVPKDYTRENFTAGNVFATILGNKKDIKGGSGKVLKTTPNDHIFIYYTDHGGPGVLGMPNDDTIFASDFVDVLKKKHASKSYKNMVIYVEACEAGSIFDGLLPKDLNIYATTASNPNESSYACYCSGGGIPIEYDGVCLGDLYSVAWMEDSEEHDATKETLEQQYNTVKNRTQTGFVKVEHESSHQSHVMQYGDLSISKEFLASYIGANSTKNEKGFTRTFGTSPFGRIEQRHADLFYLMQKVKRSEEGTTERIIAQKKLDEEISHRDHVDQSIETIGNVLLSKQRNLLLQNTVRQAGQPLVDDWDCFKSMVVTYEKNCGPLKNYGRKYLRTFANMCNAGSHRDHLALVAAQVCTT